MSTNTFSEEQVWVNVQICEYDNVLMTCWISCETETFARQYTLQQKACESWWREIFMTQVGAEKGPWVPFWGSLAPLPCKFSISSRNLNGYDKAWNLQGRPVPPDSIHAFAHKEDRFFNRNPNFPQINTQFFKVSIKAWMFSMPFAMP